MAQEFTTAFTSPNPYITHTVNNLTLINSLTIKKKDWVKKYYRIIQGIEIMAHIQIQLQNIIKLAEVVNTQLAEIETMILQVSDSYKTQNTGNIFSISQDLQNIIQENMKNQVYHIQTLLANELDKYKGRGNAYAKEYIKEIQDTYKQEDQRVEQLIIVDKEKKQENQVQDEEVFLYKSYDILSKLSKPKAQELTFIQDKIKNLDKYMKYMQLLVNDAILSTTPL